MPGPVNFRGVRLGVPICEDIWGDRDVVEMPGRDRRRAADRAERLAVLGATRTTCGSTSRWRASPRAACRSIYVNQVGGQDELVFDGASFGAACRPLARLPAAGLRRDGRRPCAGSAPATAGAASTGRSRSSPATATEDDYSACVLGLRDYVNKNGFKGVVLGLSGGIDSALVAAMAVDALGAERVRCVMLPYRYTSQDSLDDAAAVAEALGVHYDVRADRERGARAREGAGAAVRGPAARRDRGEPAGARARHHPDGDLQQVRPDGGDHRQQVGNVGRLRHALRRHERRLQSGQGPLQDRGLSAGAAAQRLEAGGRARARRAW